MAEAITSILARQAAAFASGDIEGIVAPYKHPVAIHADGEFRLRHTPQESIAANYAMRERMLRRGAVEVSWDLESYGPVDKKGIPAVVTWRFLTRSGNPVGFVRARYFYVIQTDGSLLVEMIECLASDISPTTQPPSNDGTRH